MEIGVPLECRIDIFDHVDFLAQGIGGSGADMLFQGGLCEIFDFHCFLLFLFAMRPEEHQLLLVHAVHPFEALPHADRPAQGANAESEFLLYFIEEIEGVFAFAVEFIDKYDDGGLTHAAYLHEFFGLGFHAFCDVDDDDDAVHRGERAVGVFRKILVAGGI